MSYIESLPLRRGFYFRNVNDAVMFEIRDNVELEFKREYFTNYFAEYVLLEVRTKNRMKLIPRWNLPARLSYYSKLVRARWECRLRNKGATPRYHGKIYRKEINDELIRHDLYFAVPCYYNNKKDAHTNCLTAYYKRKEELTIEHEKRGREIMKKLEQE
jgi:hypothetical protein